MEIKQLMARNQTKKRAFLRPEEVVQKLQISMPTFYRVVREGKIPGAVKVGNQWRIDAETFWRTMKEQAS